ncbi:MAG: LytTR family DNA-binding domain-containing protein [Cellulosilyticaceae bacterium]
MDQRVFAYRKHDVLEMKYKLYELENLVQHYYFMRCNKATIINIRKIETLCPQLNRALLARMENGEGVIISRKYIKELKQKIEN